jgi:hypothetical protein
MNLLLVILITALTCSAVCPPALDVWVKRRTLRA